MPLSRSLRTTNADILPKQGIPQSWARPRGGRWLLDISDTYTDIQQAAAADYTAGYTQISMLYLKSKCGFSSKLGFVKVDVILSLSSVASERPACGYTAQIPAVAIQTLAHACLAAPDESQDRTSQARETTCPHLVISPLQQAWASTLENP